DFLHKTGVIPKPGGEFDIGLAVADARLNADGSIFYDFLDHNGHIGDLFIVNGKVQPYLNVQRRKYRFRLLNAGNARIFELRLSSRKKMCIIGTDSWLLPYGVEVESFEVSSGMRHDLIIDFSEYEDGEEVYLENIMIQTDGRKSKKIDPDRPTPLLKFNVQGAAHSEAPCVDGTVIRGVQGVDEDPPGQWALIPKDELVTQRYFRFDRAMGAFTVNNRFFNPRRSDANPELGVGAEEWLWENKSGGWFHPIHTHLEGHQVITINGEPPRRERRHNQDLTMLHNGELVELRVKFRTFTGPFVFHCHTIEHEDMRMMGVVDPTPTDETEGAIDETPPLDGETRIEAAVSGVVPDCIDLEHEKYLYFDVAGDLETIDDRGVGFPECEFDITLRGNRGRKK
ncbi:MAG: multicopper oxidase domain-containing protein, partial [Myxococcales bacterium]|nr:multicopper oxidase domain-containing protein [Myxococcales bacterium]